MAKAKTIFFCKECGYESAKWMGQCPGCKAWNTFVEEPAEKKTAGRGMGISSMAKGGGRPARIHPSYLDEISVEETDRMGTGFQELDRVLGSGIVAGSLVLVGGDPGIGKSTLLLQVCGDLRFLCETNLELIQEVIEEEQPDVAVIDSIQTMFREEISSAPGSVSQVRESTNLLMLLAKSRGIAIFIVGHVTKEGMVAGPRVLEHMVDTVLYFEGDRSDTYRILRAVKNRFGSTNEIGVFEMEEEGLKEVENPSEFLLSGRPEDASGAAVACLMEGTRPILLEVQALVTATSFGMPRRTAAGTDYNRVNLLMAVLEKRCRYEMSRYDAYVNIAGGLRMNEPALDLAIVMALVSSLKDRSIDPKTVIFGEVGLSGEVRGVSMAEQRVNEAVKLGFETCILPQICLEKLRRTDGIRLIGVRNVREAIDTLK